MNGIPLINGNEYCWADVNVNIAGMVVTGITGVEYSDEQEVTDNYGAGRYPVSRSKGRITTKAKVTLYASEVAAIQRKSPNGRIQDIAPFTIVVSYIPEEGGVVITDVLENCQFKNNSRSVKEGDNNIPVDLDLACARIKWNK